jgi:Cu(I)/Ag(I) efflux system membrane fusion protein
LSASTKVRVEIPNPLRSTGDKTQRLLRHRLSADVEVHARIENVLTVPRSAILNPGGHPRVFVERAAGRYEPMDILPGRNGDLEQEVLEGLTEGDRVVTQGGFLLDAQAQLAGVSPVGIASTPPAVSTPTTTAGGLPLPAGSAGAAGKESITPAQRIQLRTFLVAADDVGAALAGDHLALFNSRLETLRKESGSLPEIPSLPALAGFSALVPKAAAPSLAEARRAFFPTSQRLVEVGRLLRTRLDGFEDVRMFQCPMTGRAFPDAPSTARWIQLTNVQRNPWLGREMPDCGTEIKP